MRAAHLTQELDRPVGEAPLGSLREWPETQALELEPPRGHGAHRFARLTLIACEQPGRRRLAIELDPAYCDVIRDRHQELTHVS
jgi:hypothetical protein